MAAEKCNVDEIVELSKELREGKKVRGEIDIITKTQIIECKYKIDMSRWNRFLDQLKRLKKYSDENNKELVYYFGTQPDIKVIKKLNEFGVKYYIYSPY